MATDLNPPSESTVTERRVPPFHVTRVHIENYKSIESCDVELEPFTILVGRNGSGKSNFLDALSFLADLAATNLPTAIRHHGGAGAILHHGAKSSVVKLQCEFGVAAQKNSRHRLRYSVEIGGLRPAPRTSPRLSRGKASITGECLEIQSARGWVQIYDRGDPSSVPAAKLAPVAVSALGATRPNTELLLRSHVNKSYEGWSQYLWAMLTRARTYNFVPNLIRPPQRFTPGERLSASADNLAGLVYEFQDDDEGKLSGPLARAEQYLCAAVPQLRSFHAALVGSERVVLRFDIEGCQTDILFDADQVSDGTLRLLASLVAAFDPDPAGFAPHVAIEEPETSVHPLAAHVLVAAFDEASAERQILITTHSDDILDAAEVTPEKILVVEFADGKTRIGAMSEADLHIIKEHLNTIGGLNRDGRLEGQL